MRVTLFLFSLIVLFPLSAFSQSALIPYDDQYYHILERLEIRSGAFSPYYHSSVKPLMRRDVAAFANNYKISGHPIGFRDFYNLGYIQEDNEDWTGIETGKRKPWLGFLYPTRTALFSYADSEFDFMINPVLNLQAGADLKRNQDVYMNTRGVEVRGSIGKKLGFYSYLTENQTRAPYYLQQWTRETGVYPSSGLTKAFKGDGYDYFQARGYITFSPLKQIMVQFGHDRNFIGDGYRSMIMSDFGKENLFLKLNTKVWKLNYQLQMAQLISHTSAGNNGGITGKKYLAFHHLSINVLKNLNIALFESIVFDRTDSNGVNQGFDMNYANPIIFYRSVEHGLSSSDNAMVGLTFKWNFLRHFSAYGQLVLDEFKLSEYRDNNGWWANKYALQAGFKYIDAFFIKNLDFQYEHNLVRPYTFMHFKRSQNYTHYNTPVGHPLGANFHENVWIFKYQPLKKLFVQLTLVNYFKGLDATGNNWGGDIINKVYEDREREYGNTIGQGEQTSVNITEMYAGYRIGHNIWLEASWLLRNSKSTLEVYGYRSSIFNVGFRMNIARARNLI